MFNFKIMEQIGNPSKNKWHRYRQHNYIAWIGPHRLKKSRIPCHTFPATFHKIYLKLQTQLAHAWIIIQYNDCFHSFTPKALCNIWQVLNKPALWVARCTWRIESTSLCIQARGIRTKYEMKCIQKTTFMKGNPCLWRKIYRCWTLNTKANWI